MIGIDEVGRGAWAGPLLVVAVRLKRGKKLPAGLKDSKLLTKKRREALCVEILKVCDIGDGWVSAGIIDQLGMSASLKSACLLSVLKLDARNDEPILLDGIVNYFQGTKYDRVTTKAKADQTEPIVSAASIVAKVMRDELLASYDEDFPGYGFASNVGYGTAKHIEGLRVRGVSSLHRLSYKPVAEFIS